MKRTDDIPASWVEVPLADISPHDLGKVLDPGFGALDPVLIPPLAEQRRIVAQVEALKERVRRARAALDAIAPLLGPLRQSVLAAAFRGDLTAGWRAENSDLEPALAFVERIRAQRRRRWEEGELARMAAAGERPEDDGWKSLYVEPASPEFYAPPCTPSTWVYLPLDELVDPREGDPERPGLGIGKDAVLITLAGVNAGDVRHVAEDLAEDQVGRGVALVRPVLADLGPYVTCYLDSAVHGQRQLRDFAYARRRPRLSLDEIKATMIPIPPRPELVEIMDRIRTSRSQAQSAVRRVAQAEGSFALLERAILAKALRGELVPQDPRDEPASALLDRIRAERSAQQAASRARRVQTKRTAAEKIRTAAEPPRPSPAPAPPRPSPAPAPVLPEHPVLASARDYTPDDWRRALLASIGDEPADRQDAIEAAAIWAAENLGLVYERLPKNSLIVRGLKSALRSAVRRGEIERLGPSQVRLRR